MGHGKDGREEEGKEGKWRGGNAGGGGRGAVRTLRRLAQWRAALHVSRPTGVPRIEAATLTPPGSGEDVSRRRGRGASGVGRGVNAER